MDQSITKCSIFLFLASACEHPSSEYHELNISTGETTPVDTAAPLSFSTQNIESQQIDDGFGAAVAVGDGSVWVGAPHGESGAIYKISGTDQSAILTGPGRLGSHLAWTSTGLWISAPLAGDGLGGVLNTEGQFIVPGFGGTGISLTAGPPIVYGWDAGWTRSDGEVFDLPHRPSSLAVRDGQVGAGMAFGPVAFKTNTGEWLRPTENDEAGFSLATADINSDGQVDWLIGAPGNNTVHGLDGASLEPLRTWTGIGRFGASIAVCDLDGNGSADLVIGAPNHTQQGAVHLYLDLGNTADQSWLGHTTGSGLGFSIDCADGDLVAGAPGRADVVGRVVIIRAENKIVSE